MRLRTAKNQNVLGGTLKLISAHCVSFLQRRRGKRIKYIPFTQYLLPNGRKIETGIFRPDEIYEKAMDIIDAGFRFEAEILRTGEVSITITDNDDVDVDIEVVENGPTFVCAVPGRLFVGINLPVDALSVNNKHLAVRTCQGYF